jgi:hypothetical protein
LHQHNIARIIANGSQDPQDLSYKAESLAIVQYFADILSLELCLNAAENNGVCDLMWKHDDCYKITKILKSLTADPKYDKEDGFMGLWD